MTESDFIYSLSVDQRKAYQELKADAKREAYRECAKFCNLENPNAPHDYVASEILAAVKRIGKEKE